MLHKDLKVLELKIRIRQPLDLTYLKADVVSQDRSSVPAAPGLIVVSLAGIDLTEEEPRLAAALLRVDVARHGEPRQQHLLRVRHRGLQQLLEVGVLRLVLVAGSSPLGDCLPVEYEDLEEGVHQQDPVRLDGGGVEKDRLRRTLEAVAVEDGLDHDEALSEVLPVETPAVEGGLVWTVVEDLQELRPP